MSEIIDLPFELQLFLLVLVQLVLLQHVQLVLVQLVLLVLVQRHPSEANTTRHHNCSQCKNPSLLVINLKKTCMFLFCFVYDYGL